MPPSPPRLALVTPLPPTPLSLSSLPTQNARPSLPTSRSHSRHRKIEREMAPLVKRETDGDGEVEEYDYIVIGGGSGGSGTARRAAGWYAAKTLLVESGKSGGCCVNVGCVPKKITWNFASISELLRDAKTYGYSTPDHTPFSFSTFKRLRDEHIATLNKGYENNWAKEGITLLQGTASFTSPHELSVVPNDGSPAKRVTAKHICIATGGHPIVPDDIPGAQYGITSDGFFELEELPEKIAVVGAGYIAVEMAGMLNAVGVEVHMFIRGETFLRSFDGMIQEVLTKRYENVGVKIHRGYKGFEKVESVGKEGEGKVLRLVGKDGSDLVVNELLWAVGRSPEVEGLGLDVAGVETKEKGYIVVDKFQNTNVEGIYGLGDVTGQLELTPVAIAAGRHLSNRLFGPPHLSQSFLNYENVPTVVFAHPEVGTIGLTTAAAAAQYPKDSIKTYTSNFSNMFYAIFSSSAKALNPTSFKLICVGEEEKVVGLHMLGLGVGEMLQGFAVAINMGATKKDFEKTVAIHPTSAEEIVTIR